MTIVRRTFARAQAVSTRAWLTAARRAVPGDLRAPTPRRVLTATPQFVSRRPSALRGRARLSALFCTVRAHHVPVAVSSAARHALPDPSRYPVRAADSQHTPECMARAAEYAVSVRRVSPRRGAVTRRDFGETRRDFGETRRCSARRLQQLRELHTLPPSVIYFWNFRVSFAVLSPNLRTSPTFPKIHHTSAE